jgi:Polyketide cyclase / dehydrase and lipid transport
VGIRLYGKRAANQLAIQTTIAAHLRWVPFSSLLFVRLTFSFAELVHLKRDKMPSASVSMVIDQAPSTVFQAVADITRMGLWSPECVAGRWVGGASGPAVGASFEGDNVAKLGPITVKRWTTTSVVTALEVDRLFEFNASAATLWTYRLEPVSGGTKVTETYAYEPMRGFEGFLYGTIFQRERALKTGMTNTLKRLKTALENGTASAIGNATK